MNKRRPVIIGPNTPTWAKETDVWVNTSNNTLYRYDGTMWDIIGGAGSASAISGYTQEQIEDFAAALLNHANHTNITASYNDSTGQVILTAASASGGSSLTQEQVQDYVGPLFAHNFHVNASASYDDGNNRIIITAASASGGSSLTQEQVQDYVGPLFAHNFHVNASASYDDENNRVLITAVSPSGGSAGMTLLYSENFTPRSSVSTPDSIFTSTYNDYKLRFVITSSSTSNALGLRLKNGLFDNSTNYYTVRDGGSSERSNFDNFVMTESAVNRELGQIYDIDLYGPALSTRTFFRSSVYAFSGTQQSYYQYGGIHNVESTFDSARLLVTAGGGTVTGYFSVYGYNK
jgi:hypothetical protein